MYFFFRNSGGFTSITRRSGGSFFVCFSAYLSSGGVKKNKKKEKKSQRHQGEHETGHLTNLFFRLAGWMYTNASLDTAETLESRLTASSLVHTNTHTFFQQNKRIKNMNIVQKPHHPLLLLLLLLLLNCFPLETLS